MPINVVFGVRASYVDEAAPWVEAATGIPGEERDSVSLGGDYYMFPAFDAERSPDEMRMQLACNRDPYDGEPVFDAPVEWEIALSVENVEPDSDILKALEADAEHFVRIT